MTSEERIQKMMMAQRELLNPGTAWLMFLLLGWSYGSRGEIGKQLAYYFTLGGLGIWAFYVLFTLGDKIKEYNNDVYKRYGLYDLVTI